MLWFVSWWGGYHVFSSKYAVNNSRLQNLLGIYVDDWAKVSQQREFRVIDTGVLTNLERNSTFFASSSLLIIAAILTAMSAADQAIQVLTELPLACVRTISVWRWSPGLCNRWFLLSLYRGYSRRFIAVTLNQKP